MVAEDLICNLGDTHIYSNHVEQVDEQLARADQAMALPKLVLKKQKDIFSYKFEDITLENYKPLPSISAPISV